MGEQDFIQKNGAFLLTCFGLMGTCLAGLTVYAIRSRCTRISCCGSSCDRDVVPSEMALRNV